MTEDIQNHTCKKCGYTWLGKPHPCVVCEKEEFDIWFKQYTINCNKIER